MKRLVCILILAACAASCSSGAGQTGSALVSTAGNLDEAKAREVLKQYLAKENSLGLGPLSPFFRDGNRVEVNFTAISTRGFTDRGMAVFRLAQDGKWYLADTQTGMGGMSMMTPNLEIK